MESKFFTSSAKVGSTKRGFSDEVQESPTEKRAKRAKRSKKRRSKGEKDWVSFDQNSTPFSPVARKQTPTKPPTPFPLKKAHSAYVQRSADKTKETLGSENERDAKESLKQGTAQQSLKTETNTRKKVRGEPGVNNAAHDPIEDASSRIPTTTDGSPKEHVPKKHRKRPNRQERPYVPAVAGPSKPKVANKLAPADRELTPLSDITTPVDYTFKAFPNPPAIQNIDGKDKDKDKEPQSALRGKETKDRDRDRLDSLRSNRVKSMRQARKTLEQCLRTYTEDLNRAGSVEEVARHGGLCVQYAGDLFKTLG
ncbi:hypothetical protein N658DRAFT_427739 [Parathielavia hyrcaniae]|uniref:Uncharacterized protein n=1 Tax=Parathielavia hyrcaniae TaxID=113614 RepID=A0AAN6T151_9PEZI|nr:hypothetical protein N658DRAFT_427739 [Parathielavia hyrcaniae]